MIKPIESRSTREIIHTVLVLAAVTAAAVVLMQCSRFLNLVGG